jgi:hypothetical protein
MRGGLTIRQVTTVIGFSHQLRAILDDMPRSPSGLPPDVLSHLRGVADGMENEVKKLKAFEIDFEVSSHGKKDAKGRPKIPKIKWARHQSALSELRARVSRWKDDISGAVSLLQTTQR